MTTFSKQLLTGVLALSAALVGLWALFAPQAFYDSFPGFGRHWVSMVGAYNEHLIRDVGGLYLALLVLSVWAVCRPATENFRITGLAWAVFSVPHLVFHLGHLGMYSTFDKVGNVVSLAGTLVLALLLVLPSTERNSR